MIFQATIPLVRHRHIDPLDGMGLLGEVVSKQQVACFVQTAFLKAQASDAKAPEASVDALVFADFLPDILHVAAFSFGNISTYTVSKSQ